jgi:predicted nucleic acid-binding protein
MPEMDKVIVINTGPIIALIAATGNLDVLEKLFDRVIVTQEVKNEICYHGESGFGVAEFLNANFLTIIKEPVNLSAMLKNSLDRGEASVIQYAINNNIDTVCIDEVAGRRIARLNELKLTGSIGVLIRAKKEGIINSLREALLNMKNQGVFISKNLIERAITLAEE